MSGRKEIREQALVFSVHHQPVHIQPSLARSHRKNQALGIIAQALLKWDDAISEAAWVEHYLQLGTWRGALDHERVDWQTPSVVTRRQAWQFGLLPLRREDGLLVAATTAGSLRRAFGFAWDHLCEPVLFLVTSEEELERHLMVYHPWEAGRNLRRQRLAAQPPHPTPFDAHRARRGADRF